jgi:hypothetical protein
MLVYVQLIKSLILSKHVTKDLYLSLAVSEKLHNLVNSEKLLTPFQSGFIKGDSTINQLTFLYNDISKVLDEGKEVRAVFCDLSQAFERRQKHLYKLLL